VRSKPRSLLVLRHASWEGPHRILDAFEGIEVRTVEPLRGEPLPAHDEIAGVVAMGGPMNVDETERYPELSAEREWLAEAVDREMPVLGVCLGAQLLARALGAEVRPGEGPEIGFAPVEILDASDPLLGGLAPEAEVLHWHGDVFDLPEGAVRLASSGRTGNQAFRFGESAWGVLFHPEADFALLESWLAEASMMAEARAVLGDAGVAELPERAVELEPALIERSQPGFRAFAALVCEQGRPAT
jgi:GMP synthase (glutamine-hydrolysing)